MKHAWACPICKEPFLRESLDAGILDAIIMSRQDAMIELQWDAINHLATHIQTVNTSKGKGDDEARRLEVPDAVHKGDASPGSEVHSSNTKAKKDSYDSVKELFEDNYHENPTYETSVSDGTKVNQDE